VLFISRLEAHGSENFLVFPQLFFLRSIIMHRVIAMERMICMERLLRVIGMEGSRMGAVVYSYACLSFACFLQVHCAIVMKASSMGAGIYRYAARFWKNHFA